jgi:hypothetical protein
MSTTNEVSPHVWTPGDSQQARGQGWDLFVVSGGKNHGLNMLERIDEGGFGPVFSSDEAVIWHLNGRTDPLAKKALAMHRTRHVVGSPLPSDGRVRTLIAVIEVQESERSTDPYLPTRSTMASCVEGIDKEHDAPWLVTDVTVYASFEELAAAVAEGDPDLTPLRFCRADQEGDDGI